MPTTSSTFTDLYAPGLRKIFFENFSYLPSQYTAWLNEGTSKRQYEDDYQMAGFGAVPIKAEGTPITYDDPIPGSTTRYTWTARGKGFRITHEAMMDELYGQMKKMSKAMGRAFNNQVELIAAAILDSAFTDASGNNEGFDAKALCATDHTLLRTGATFRNEPSANVDLSVSALTDALTDFQRWLDESGVPIVIPAKKLLISPEDLPLAREILGSQFKPFTADNEINVLQNELQIVLSHHKTDTKSWFVLADKGDTDLHLTWREKLTTDASDDFDTGDGKMKGYMRLGVGYGDYRGVWGSDGT